MSQIKKALENIIQLREIGMEYSDISRLCDIDIPNDVQEFVEREVSSDDRKV